MTADYQVAKILPSPAVAVDTTFEDYLEQYAANFCEFVGNVVISMSPIHERHDLLTRYLVLLLAAYFDLKPIGRIRQAPFVMRLEEALVAREPDIQIILNHNPHALTPTFMDGPANICIEVVSPESVERDHGQKFVEYEKGGVEEYWIVDPLRQETRFYRLNAEGTYIPFHENSTGDYQTPALPDFGLHVPTLWQDPLPGYGAVWEAVQSMLRA